MQRGTTPDEMEQLINCVRNGANPSATCFSSHVGNGSSARDVVGDLVMSLRISDINAVANVCTRGTLGLCCSSASKLGVTAELLHTVARIISIFAEKKLAKQFASSCVSWFCGRHADFRRCTRLCMKRYSRLELPPHCTSTAALVTVGIEANVDNAMSSRNAALWTLVYFRLTDRFPRNAWFNHVDNALDAEVIGEKRRSSR